MNYKISAVNKTIVSRLKIECYWFDFSPSNVLRKIKNVNPYLAVTFKKL